MSCASASWFSATQLACKVSARPWVKRTFRETEFISASAAVEKITRATITSSSVIPFCFLLPLAIVFYRYRRRALRHHAEMVLFVVTLQRQRKAADFTVR